MLANPAAVLNELTTTKAEHTKGAFLPTHVYSNLIASRVKILLRSTKDMLSSPWKINGLT